MRNIDTQLYKYDMMHFSVIRLITLVCLKFQFENDLLFKLFHKKKNIFVHKIDVIFTMLYKTVFKKNIV